MVAYSQSDVAIDHVEDTVPTDDLPLEIVQTEPCKRKRKNVSKLPITITHLHRQANKKKFVIVQIKASQRITNQRMPHSTIIKVDKKTIRKKRMTNFVDSEQVINKPKASKKSKSSHLDDGTGPTRHTDKDDKLLLAEEMDFHIWSELEDDMYEATRAHKSQLVDEVKKKKKR